MKKVVVETVQTIVHRYFCEVNEPEWAGDSVAMEELEPFESVSLGEQIYRIDTVDSFKRAEGSSVNAATYVFNYDTHKFDSKVDWSIT